ncbi:rho GTPase-activating protein Graf isoform X1 [Drosophila bipectinata]|uniref:rho GTPase-activating protein Graf isoform X1 n=1 Tax=Drosophila bipectinata TaxID=42026 RepID=UPI001C8A6293|nr:rho GTPase-activating protein 26 isoform X1 [Drosophila bipectinata]
MGGGNDIRCGLEPLEFEECIIDSPEFRENLNQHEKELDHTSHQIKRIIKEVKDLMTAAKVLSTRMKQLAILLNDFNFECIGNAQTDDENVICESLKRFCGIIGTIEDEREKMLTLADKHIIESLEEFRKKQIGGVKENKKKFDKKTEKFCQSQERFLNMSTKKPENTLQEADASLGMHEREYIQESLSYVLRIQEVQERIKFEFVEILLAFISGWLVFYHTAHEQAEDHRDYLQDLRHKVQKTRENFEEAREKVTELKTKYMEKRTPEEIFTKRGYLFLMEKSSLLKISLLEPFKASWTKYYCTFKKQKREFTLLQFNQMNHNFTRPEAREDEKLTLFSCHRRASEFEKRFCFDLTFKEKPGVVYTFQALSEKDHFSWLNAMDGTEPINMVSGKIKSTDSYQLNESGFIFVRRCIEVLESRGLEDEGIYRKSGVGTKISKLLTMGLNISETEDIFTDEKYSDLIESNTIASALKMYLRNLSEPLMTYRYHNDFIESAKIETQNQRINEVHKLVHKLPHINFEMLDLVIFHLTEVSRKYEKNKMSVFNLGVVFGPTLLRPREESVAAILDIKFNNIVINILIDNYDRIFKINPNSKESFLETTSALSINHTGRHSPPKRMPRTSHYQKSLAGDTGCCAKYPQKKIYRVIMKPDYTEPTISSSLQSIPNVVKYGYNSGSNLSTFHNTNELGQPKHAITINPNTMTQKDKVLYCPATSSSADNVALSSYEGTNSEKKPLGFHVASSSSSNNMRHSEFERTSASMGSESASGTHFFVSTSSSDSTPTNLLNQKRMTTASKKPRKDYILGSDVSDPKQHVPNKSSLYSYRLAKNYASVMTASTSSSNESVSDCSNSGLGCTKSENRDIHSQGTNEFVASIAPLSTILGAVSNDMIADKSSCTAESDTATATSNRNVHSATNDISLYVPPTKTHRTRDINQIKRDLSTGAARVRTLYACMGESEGELSFEPNQIITNVRFSHEPGWLQGTLNGKTGLIPENYVEHLKTYK